MGEVYFLITKNHDTVDIISASLGTLIGVERYRDEDNVPLTAEETKGMFIDILPELRGQGVAKVKSFIWIQRTIQSLER